jgi:hypothetical protein
MLTPTHQGERDLSMSTRPGAWAGMTMTVEINNHHDDGITSISVENIPYIWPETQIYTYKYSHINENYYG